MRRLSKSLVGLLVGLLTTQLLSVVVAGGGAGLPDASAFLAATPRIIFLGSDVAIDRNGHVYVVDSRNNRVLGYRSTKTLVFGASADLVIGQPGFFSSSCGNALDALCLANCPARLPFGGRAGSGAIAVDSAGDLYVADTCNRRVLEFASPYDSGSNAGETGEVVLGRSAAAPGTCDNTDSLCRPDGVSIDGRGNLIVSDTVNNRIVSRAIPAASITATPVVTPMAGAFLAPQIVLFSSQTVGTTSAPQTLTLANNQSAALHVSAIAIASAQGAAVASEFSERDTCGINPPNASLTTIGPFGHCTINLTFTPGATGPQGATLTAGDDSPGRPTQAASLFGVGVASTPGTAAPTPAPGVPDIVISSPVDTVYTVDQVVNAVYTCSEVFGTIESCVGTVPNGSPVDTSSVGTKSFTVVATDAMGKTASQTVNYSVVDLTAPTVTIVSPANTVYQLGEAVAANYSCSDPAAPVVSCVGPVPDGANIDTSLTGSKNFTVTATDAGGLTSSQTVTYTVLDTGPPSITIIAPVDRTYGLNQIVDADYSCTDASTCSGTVADGSPIDTSSLGPETFTVNASSINGAKTSQRVFYTVVPISPTSLLFEPQFVGTRSAPQIVTVTNFSSTAQQISGITVGGDFRLVSHCRRSLASQATCTISVRFVPTRIGARSGVFSVVEGGSPLDVALDGIGTRATLSPRSLAFPATSVGKTSKVRRLTLSNGTGSPLALSGIPTTGDFTESDNCGAQLAPHRTCRISVHFAPTATGPRTGILTVNSSLPPAPPSIPLSGNGLAAKPARP